MFKIPSATKYPTRIDKQKSNFHFHEISWYLKVSLARWRFAPALMCRLEEYWILKFAYLKFISLIDEYSMDFIFFRFFPPI